MGVTRLNVMMKCIGLAFLKCFWSSALSHMFLSRICLSIFSWLHGYRFTTLFDCFAKVLSIHYQLKMDREIGRWISMLLKYSIAEWELMKWWWKQKLAFVAPSPHNLTFGAPPGRKTERLRAHFHSNATLLLYVCLSPASSITPTLSKDSLSYLGAKHRRCVGTYCIHRRSSSSALESTAAHCRKVMKFGTWIEDSLNTNHSDFGHRSDFQQIWTKGFGTQVDSLNDDEHIEVDVRLYLYTTKHRQPWPEGTKSPGDRKNWHFSL